MISDTEVLDINLDVIPVKTNNGKIVVEKNGDPGTAGVNDSSSVTSETAGDEGSDDNIRTGPAVLSVSNISGSVGEIVKVLISIENPKGMAGGNLVLSYDPSLIEPVKVSSGSLLSGLIPLSNLAHSESSISVVWIGLTGKTTDGTIIELSFSLKDEGTAELSIIEYALVNAVGEDIDVLVESGSIQIAEDKATSTEKSFVTKKYYLYIMVIVIVIVVLTVFFLLKRGRDKRNNKDEFFEH